MTREEGERDFINRLIGRYDDPFGDYDDGVGADEEEDYNPFNDDYSTEETEDVTGTRRRRRRPRPGMGRRRPGMRRRRQ
ncbi:MAG: hypothetical protein ABIO70_15920 [Pseudomonadota bacterium]